MSKSAIKKKFEQPATAGKKIATETRVLNDKILDHCCKPR